MIKDSIDLGFSLFQLISIGIICSLMTYLTTTYFYDKKCTPQKIPGIHNIRCFDHGKFIFAGSGVKNMEYFDYKFTFNANTKKSPSVSITGSCIIERVD